MSKTLGQVAEDAYEAAGVVDPALAWQAAAEAVLERAKDAIHEYATTLPAEVVWDGPVREVRPSGRAIGLMDAKAVLDALQEVEGKRCHECGGVDLPHESCEREIRERAER